MTLNKHTQDDSTFSIHILEYNSSAWQALSLFLKTAMCVLWHPPGVSTVASSVRFKELGKRVVTVMTPKRGTI